MPDALDSPTDDEPDLDSIVELFVTERIGLADARAQVAWHEHQLKELAKAHPEAAALLSPDSEYTKADLRSDELNATLSRINPTLKLTGDEEDYWLKLWDYARANLGVSEDEFDGMTREDLAAVVEAGLPSVPFPVTSDDSASVAAGGADDNFPVQMSSPPKGQRNKWARSRSPHAGILHASVREMEMKSGGLTQLQMCDRLDALKLRPSDLVGWRHLTWRSAYQSTQYRGPVKKWLSNVTSVTP
jgi:hypothetical protein